MMRWLFAAVASMCMLCGEEYEFLGTHYIASFKECDTEALCDVETLKHVVAEAVETSGATILSTNSYVFEPNGLTMVLLLSESHASIHTYPEHNACFVDLFTCGTKCSYKGFAKKLAEYLKPSHVEEDTVSRS